MPLKARKHSGGAAALRIRAEERLLDLRKGKEPEVQLSGVDVQRVLHELQVHQIQLEMQNAELLEARIHLEELLEKFTDLYDFSPVGFFSLDESGRILEVNLTGAALVGVERSLLVNRGFISFVQRGDLATFKAILDKAFSSHEKQVAEVALVNKDGKTVWVDLQAAHAVCRNGGERFCRVAVADITSLRRAIEAQRRMEALVEVNRELKLEILRRKATEQALKNSKDEVVQALKKAKRMEAQLRHLTHRVLQAQEEERKRISVELHDEVSQALACINIHLAGLAKEAKATDISFKRSLAKTQRLVAKTVGSVHRFAMQLRPTILDDLGLIPALHSSLEGFSKRYGAHVEFRVFSGLEKLGSDRRIVLYRVVQAALANIVKHAKATRVKVNIEEREGGVYMEIHDNGKAFDVENVLYAKRHKRMGLIGMRERVEMVGGKFGVTSSPGDGTSIRVELPESLNRKAGAASPT